MRTKFEFVLFLLFLNTFGPSSAGYSLSLITADTSSSKAASQPQTFHSHLHFALVYGRASFNTRESVVSSFAESGYYYQIISRADPSAEPGQPIVYSFTIEGNISKQVFLGVQYAKTLKQNIKGSNWIGAKEDQKVVPVEQFDVKESYAARYINVTLNYIVVPVNFTHSRWEITFGTGLSYNSLKLSGMQRFERHPNIYTAFDDTVASYKFSKNGLGFLFSGSMDFYWSRFISSQFKLEFRRTPSLEVPAQTLTFVTTRARVRITDTHTLKKHSIRYSGTVLSFGFRFHI